MDGITSNDITSNKISLYGLDLHRITSSDITLT